MKRSRTTQLSRLELEVMDLLWDAGEASIRELHERLPEKKRAAYTTIQTIVGRLEQKGAVARTGKTGNAHIFKPLIARRSAYARVIGEVLALFDGSAVPLVAHLVETGKLSLEDLRAAERLLDESSSRAGKKERDR
jgi:BlaI family transcriptional regulator, penicillinase repressor